MIPGPVFTYELLTLARRKRSYLLRALYGTALLVLVISNAPLPSSHLGEARALSINEVQYLTSYLFGMFTVTQSLTVLILTPALTAGVIADERQRKTLHYLLSSSLSSAEIVLGKAAARLALVWVLVAAGVPIFSLLSFLGGIDPYEVFLLALGTVSTTILLTAIGITVSVHAKKPVAAVSQTYFLESAWLFGPMTLRAILTSLGGIGINIYEHLKFVIDWAEASSPAVLLTPRGGFFAGRGGLDSAVLTMVGCQLLASVPILLIAILRLRPVFKQEGTRGRRHLGAWVRRVGRIWPRPACGDDAMLWKECRVSKSSPGARLMAMVIFVAAAAVLGFATYQVGADAIQEFVDAGYTWNGSRNHRESFNIFARVIASAIYCCWAIGVGGAAAAGVTGERESDTLLSLLSTPLTALEIIRGKLIGAICSTRWIGFFWVVLLTLALVIGALHPVGLILAIVANTVFLFYAAALGTFYSVICRTTTQALMATILTGLFTNLFYLILLIPLQPDSPVWFAGVSPLVEGMALMNLEDFHAGSHRFLGSSNYLAWSLTYLVSVVGHGAVGFGLTTIVLGTFDKRLDRPHGGSRASPVSHAIDDDDWEGAGLASKAKLSPTGNGHVTSLDANLPDPKA